MTPIKYEEFFAFGKENVEALVQSSTLAAKGFEELTKAYAAYAGHNIDKATEAMKALSTAKTPVEFMQLQAQITKESTESMIAESKKLAEIVKAIVTSSMEPLQSRFKVAADLYKVAA